MKVSANFELKEFVPKEIYKAFGDNSIWFIDRRIITIAQLLRTLTGRVVVINDDHYNESGYRVPNTKTGAKYSQHKFGRAIDVKVEGMTPQEVFDLIMEHEKEFLQAGLTTMEDITMTPTWNHLDCRETLDKTKILIVQP